MADMRGPSDQGSLRSVRDPPTASRDSALTRKTERLGTPAGTHSGWPDPFNWPGNWITFA